MNGPHCSLFEISLVLSCLLGAPVIQADENSNDLELGQRFLREAPPAWGDYLRQAARFQGTFAFKMSASLKKTKAENEYEFKMNRQSKLISIFTDETLEA